MNPTNHNRLRTLAYGIIFILCGVAVVLLALHFTQSTTPQHPGISQAAPQKQTVSQTAGNSVVQTMNNSSTSVVSNPSNTASTSSTTTPLTDTGPTNVATVFIVTTVVASALSYSRQLFQNQPSR